MEIYETKNLNQSVRVGRQEEKAYREIFWEKV